MRVTVAVLEKKGGNAVQKVISTIQDVLSENVRFFELATPTKIAHGKDEDTLKNQKIRSPIAVGIASTHPEQNFEHMLKLKEGTIAFEGRIYSTKPETTPIDFFAKKTQTDFKKAAKSFLRSLDGDYSIFQVQTENILAIRDPIGVQPMYFGESKDLASFASNRKALWNLDIEEIRSVPPGHLVKSSKNGFAFEPLKSFTYAEPKMIDLDSAAKKLQELLENSVKRRVSHQEQVAVAFSGGLDSCVVALLAKKYVPKVCLIHISMEGQPEIEEARKGADELGLPIQIHLFKESDVEKVVPIVVDLIEEPDPFNVSVGVPFYWTAQKAAKSGWRVLLAGQGADELFGGYLRYVKEYLLKGDESLRRTMYSDVETIHETNLERDEKIFNFHDVELRLPFATCHIVNFALSLPTELKIDRDQNCLRKTVLRKTAKNMGLSDNIANKPKRAVQYSTGISNALKRISKKHNSTLRDYITQLFEEARKNHEIQ